MRKHEALEFAQNEANRTGITQYVYWLVYGCEWTVTDQRNGSGANVNYEHIINRK